MRTQMARASGVVNQRRDHGRSDFEIDYLGIRAELAVAKLYNIPFDPRAIGVDAGHDMWVDEHISIDVKASFHGNGHLLFKGLKAFRSDYAIMVAATAFEEVMHICGWVSRERFIRESESGEQMASGKGTGRIMHRDKLSRPETFVRRMAQDRFQRNVTIYPLKETATSDGLDREAGAAKC